MSRPYQRHCVGMRWLAYGECDNYPREIRQAGGAARIYGMTLCRTEAEQGNYQTVLPSVFQLCTARYTVNGR